MAPDEGHVVEDAQTERDECHEIEVQTEAIADEGQEYSNDGIDQEPADKDPIVVDPVELSANRPEDRIEGSQDRDRRVSAEFEADVDIEDEAAKDTDKEPKQR
jgi:hypothetical protein